jgi:hypothetical protein
MIPSFLELPKKEEEVFLSIITNNLKPTLNPQLDDIIEELNKKFIDTINSHNNIKKINTIKDLSKVTAPIFIEKWILKNTLYKTILGNLLQQTNFKSLLTSSSLDIFMQQIITIDTDIPNNFFNTLMNFSIPAHERYFSYLLIKTSDFLNLKFKDSKYYIASSVCKDVYGKIGFNPHINKQNHIQNNNKVNIPKDKKWKLYFY